MFRLAVRLPAPGLSSALWAAALLSLLPLPSAANILPESALLMHVQPVGAGCATPITHCEQIVDFRSTLGTYEFLLYFMPIHWQQANEPIDIRAIDCSLSWPEAWQFVEGEVCDYWGYDLHLAAPPYQFHYDYTWAYQWDCPDLPIGDHEVFLVARFVFNVTEPGSFGCYDYGNTVTLDCANPFPSYAGGFTAAVGCGNYASSCAYGYSDCWAHFHPNHLVLSAPLGGTATGEAELEWGMCNFGGVYALVDWLDVETRFRDANNYVTLAITADASGLAAGTYEGWVRGSFPYAGISPCMSVTFIVSETTPTNSPSWGTIKSLY
jgi:hypothetical protein